VHRLVLAAGVLVLVLVLTLVVTFLPLGLAVIEGLVLDVDKAEEADRIRTALLALGAGILATVGAFYTHRAFELNRSGQITDRFSRAISELGDANPRVCLGGIYALERIARDSRRDHPRVMEVLTAYVRAEAPVNGPVQARWPWKVSWTAHERREPKNEVQAALAVLARRKACWDEHRLDLKGVDLRGAKLPKDANLRGAILKGTSLERAELSRVDFRPRQFPDECASADLTDTHLEGANLKDARLEGARLERADLRGANLSRAKLNRAHLEGADLTGAKLDGAERKGAWVDAETKSETLHADLSVRFKRAREPIRPEASG
jgi:Pentapeptide repeats (8 copies)